MRKTRNQQLPLAEVTPDHPKAKEFAQISAILDSNNSIYLLARQDLGISDNSIGANGMTAEQVVRAAIIRQTGCYTYRELAFHLSDSRVYRHFCKIGIGKAFKKSSLQQGIKALSDETWEQINGILLDYAEDQDIETFPYNVDFKCRSSKNMCSPTTPCLSAFGFPVLRTPCNYCLISYYVNIKLEFR